MVTSAQSECLYRLLDQEKVTQELAKDIARIIQKSGETKNMNLPVRDCEKIAGQVARRYVELNDSYEMAYRQYRIDHFSKFFKGSEDDKKMKIMVRLAQDMGGRELIDKFIKAEKILDNTGAALSPDEHLAQTEALAKSREEIENQIISRYKALIKNYKAHSGGNPFFTFSPKIDCGSDEVNADVMPGMISTDERISLQNYCTRYPYDYQNYPEELSRMIFTVGDGRVEIWNCQQIFNAIFIPPVKKNDGHFKVDGTANCLGFDVVSGRYLDHHSLEGHDDHRLVFMDRMEQYYLAKGFNKTNPVMSRAKFVESMGKKEITFDQFYDQNIPSKCAFWSSIKDHFRSMSVRSNDY